MLDPLTQLRADWRQAVAVTVPASAQELADILDRSLDLLKEHNQLDQDGLDMAIQVISDALPLERPETLDILRERLGRAARDYLAQVGVGDEGGLGDAFDSAANLAEALFAMASGDMVADDAPEEQGSESEEQRMQAAELRKTLAKEQRRQQRSFRKTFGRVFGVVRIVLIIGLIALAAYFFLHPNVLQKTVNVTQTNIITSNTT